MSLMADLLPCIVVAPVFQEESNIRDFVERLHKTISPGSELIIVDDGCTDQTVELLRHSAASIPRDELAIRLVTLSRNFGHQRAVIAGLEVAAKRARETTIDCISVIDADLQDRPEHIGDLLAAIENHDVAYAIRASRRESMMFRIGADIFYKALARWARSPVPPNAGTFSMMRTSVVDVMLDNVDENVFFPGLRAWVGFDQVSVPLDRDGRQHGESRVGLKGLIRLAVGALFGYSKLPLRLMMIFSAGSLALSALAVLTMTVLKLGGFVAVEGVPLLVVLIFFSLSVLAIFLTILAYMVSRNPSPVQTRALYVIAHEASLN